MNSHEKKIYRKIKYRKKSKKRLRKTVYKKNQALFRGKKAIFKKK